MIPEPGDTNRKVPVNETFHVQTDDELNEKELKQIEADDQAIHTILLGLPEDIYAAVDSCETTQKSGNANLNGNGNLVASRAEGNAAGHNGIQLQAEEFDLMAAATDLDEIKEVYANCILMAICSKHRPQVLRLTKLPSIIQTDQLRLLRKALSDLAGHSVATVTLAEFKGKLKDGDEKYMLPTVSKDS
uniref:Uncharacterized protein n=1 Tax=Tanacetum cinerariifolium TaxID=118510 RepID=A0A6L2JIU2_TANCI|nr:hypothetical protein [Tanacetum cinerariifolium]